jgi:glutamyl/glutaminyl-tRNA synthetase
MSQVRVRFAPSPTGFFHIGSARTALFNWLYARHTGGVFILRIEDTDKERNSEEFLRVIYESLRWLGMDWVEGPGVGGNFGPYRQSERAAIYREYIERLRAAGRTYEKDGATFFRISGEPQVIDDAIRGRVVRTEEKDFVIVRSDGNPVFHFVNVVDDLAMQVTHVIRGEDHLSNTSKHTELFRAFGALLPVYAHIPLILKQNGPGKMSKRDQGALIEEYQRRGFQPDALVNFLCLLGWSPKNDAEKMPLEEIIRRPQWEQYKPLMELRPLYAELKKPTRRLRKDGSESRKDGTLVSNPCRMGPLTLESRMWALGRVLDIQRRAGVDLINSNEEARIRELIVAETWPRGWSGLEPIASQPFDNVNPDGSIQPIMRGLYS